MTEPRASGVAASSEPFAARAARASAFMDALYTAKLGVSGCDPIETLRESYAKGEISIGTFEAKVEVLLRRAA